MVTRRKAKRVAKRYWPIGIAAGAPIWTYVFATVLGILPGSLIETYIGVIDQNLAGGEQIAYLALDVVVTVAAAAVIAMKAKGALQDAGVKT